LDFRRFYETNSAGTLTLRTAINLAKNIKPCDIAIAQLSALRNEVAVEISKDVSPFSNELTWTERTGRLALQHLQHAR
jgi:hypothetical protein